MSQIPKLLALSTRSGRCAYNLLKTRHSSVCIFSQSQRPVHVQAIHFASSQNFWQKPSSLNAGVDQSEWHTVFRFPLIVYARVFSRSKLYMTAISLLTSPNAIICHSSGVITLNQMLSILSITCFSTALLYSFGHMFRRLIGSIYISPDGNLVRISHLTFFGNRQETVVQLCDIAPLVDSNPNMRDIFLRVTATDLTNDALKHPLYLSLRFGGIVDREKFMQVFGTL